MNSFHRYLLGLGLALGLLASSYTTAQAYFGISVNIAPPPLPLYVQPACPGYGYIWTPGYWAWDADDNDYYWVPGAWVQAPEFGLLWTPCWWGWSDGAYCFHRGYWGQDVGFYGGINYGFGYGGRGYDGGYWRGHQFYYNRAANNVAGLDPSRTFSRPVAAGGSRVSFNGGARGTMATATPAEQRAAGEHHFAATSAQNIEARTARTDPGQRFTANHGRPQVTGTARAGNFRTATAESATRESHVGATGPSAFTGQSRSTGATGETAFTGENHHAGAATGEAAYTGESRSASANAAERSARAERSAEAERSASAERTAEAERSARAERTAEVERSQAAQSRAFPEPSRASSYHAPAYAAPAVHEPSCHSSGMSHAGGFGGGGGSFHPAASHVGGFGGGGASHASAGAAHFGGGAAGGGGGHAAGGGGGAHH